MASSKIRQPSLVAADSAKPFGEKREARSGKAGYAASRGTRADGGISKWRWGMIAGVQGIVAFLADSVTVPGPRTCLDSIYLSCGWYARCTQRHI